MKWVAAVLGLILLVLAVRYIPFNSTGTVFGKGKIITEPRKLSSFDVVNVADNFHVFIKVDANAKSAKAVITSYQNLM